MVTVTIEKDEKIETMAGDAIITVAISEITEKMHEVTINITGKMRGVQIADTIGDATAKILKEIADESDIPEIVLQEVFLGRFLEAGRKSRWNGRIKKIQSKSYGLKTSDYGVLKAQ